MNLRFPLRLHETSTDHRPAYPDTDEPLKLGLAHWALVFSVL